MKPIEITFEDKFGRTREFLRHYVFFSEAPTQADLDWATREERIIVILRPLKFVVSPTHCRQLVDDTLRELGLPASDRIAIFFFHFTRDPVEAQADVMKFLDFKFPIRPLFWSEGTGNFDINIPLIVSGGRTHGQN